MRSCVIVYEIRLLLQLNLVQLVKIYSNSLPHFTFHLSRVLEKLHTRAQSLTGQARQICNALFD